MTEFKIPDKAKYLISFIEYLDNTVIKITFTDRYNNREIALPFNVKNIKISLKNIESKVKKIVPEISIDEYNEIENIICSNVVESNESVSDQTNQEIKKKEATVNKYSQNRKADLYESILIQNVPIFLNITNVNNNNDENENEEIKLIPEIDENTRILKPPSLEEYLHNPYEFTSIDDIKNTIKQARKETIFSLYSKFKSIVSKYIDQEDHIINLVTIDIIFSYFQDRFNTTHYTGVFGENGSGKSSIGDIVEALAYRAMNTTDPTPANIFRSLGSIEAGQITLILDEAERIDQSTEMMSILKTGYDFKKQVSRINQFSGKPEKFYTYCSKMIIGERPPSQNIARGVMDRTFANNVFIGNPKYDIKEILNPTDTGGDQYKNLLTEIIEFRKLLFVFRLIHFKDAIPNTDIGITGRNKELIKPYLQLFSNPQTEKDKKIYKEIENTFQILLKIKNDRKNFTLEAALFPIIIELLHESKTKIISFSDFWNRLKDNINGHFDDKKPNEYHTEEFGTIYRNSISNILQKFGVDSKRHNQYTELVFNTKKIQKNASQYNISIQTKLSFEGERCDSSEHPIEDVIENNQMCANDIRSINNETVNKEHSHNEFSNYIDEDIISIECNNKENQPMSPNERPQGSRDHPSTTNQNEEIKNNIYRIGNTDMRGCKRCNIKGDIWFMQKHPCKGLVKTQKAIVT